MHAVEPNERPLDDDDGDFVHEVTEDELGAATGADLTVLESQPSFARSTWSRAPLIH